jgi:TonB family protein
VKSKIEFFVIVVVILLLPGAAYPQQGQTNPKPDSQKGEAQQQESVADAARRLRAEKAPPDKASPEDSQPLQIIHATPAPYPPEARERRIVGTVVLKVWVNKEGNVVKATVVSGHPVFSASALDAVKEWKFKPATLQGQPVETTTQIHLNFSDKSAGAGR